MNNGWVHKLYIYKTKWNCRHWKHKPLASTLERLLSLSENGRSLSSNWHWKLPHLPPSEAESGLEIDDIWLLKGIVHSLKIEISPTFSNPHNCFMHRRNLKTTGKKHILIPKLFYFLTFRGHSMLPLGGITQGKLCETQEWTWWLRKCHQSLHHHSGKW